MVNICHALCAGQNGSNRLTYSAESWLRSCAMTESPIDGVETATRPPVETGGRASAPGRRRSLKRSRFHRLGNWKDRARRAVERGMSEAAAARHAGVSPQALSQARIADPTFAQALEDAHELARTVLLPRLRATMYDRAMTGCPKVDRDGKPIILEADEDITLPSGQVIPAGARVPIMEYDTKLQLEFARYLEAGTFRRESTVRHEGEQVHRVYHIPARRSLEDPAIQARDITPPAADPAQARDSADAPSDAPALPAPD